MQDKAEIHAEKVLSRTESHPTEEQMWDEESRNGDRTQLSEIRKDETVIP